jgi:hypothetical protein
VDAGGAEGGEIDEWNEWRTNRSSKATHMSWRTGSSSVTPLASALKS